MSESTLTLGFRELLSEVGQYLGYGKGDRFGDKTWTKDQRGDLESIVQSGLRQFYNPPILQGETDAYSWSFTKPTASIEIASGASTATLPDDFGGFEGDLTISSTSSVQWWSIPTTNEGVIRERHMSQPTTTGRPQMAAVQPLKGTTGREGQRYQLYVWPLTDTSYTLRAPYYYHPKALTESLPYALGGMGHSETILESCLAIAEQRLDDTAAIHTMKFMERLAASVALDRRMKPQQLGYNGDRSDMRDRDYPYRFRDFPGIRVNGVIP